MAQLKRRTDNKIETLDPAVNGLAIFLYYWPGLYNVLGSEYPPRPMRWEIFRTPPWENGVARSQKMGVCPPKRACVGPSKQPYRLLRTGSTPRLIAIESTNADLAWRCGMAVEIAGSGAEDIARFHHRYSRLASQRCTPRFHRDHHWNNRVIPKINMAIRLPIT